jgi:uncharacterized protein (TIGR03083 family)
MDPEEYLDALARGSDSLADAAVAAGLGAPVPTCPGWTVADLLGHLVGGDTWARTIVEQAKDGRTERVDRGHAPDGLEGDALVQAFRDGERALHDALASADPATPAWTFSKADRTVTFWLRRRAHETTVHRFDAEIAAGTPTPVDAALAVDGIDEYFDFFLPRQAEHLAELGDATVHLHCTDTDGEWLIRRRDGEVEVTREHAKGDVAARGSASDLLLFIWGRVPADRLDVFGDTELLERFRAGLAV